MGTINQALNSAGPAIPEASKNPADRIVSQEMFLQMLVAQIKNQDPLNPMDGVQFLTQLAQFSELEQLIGIRGDLKSLERPEPALPPAA